MKKLILDDKSYIVETNISLNEIYITLINDDNENELNYFVDWLENSTIYDKSDIVKNGCLISSISYDRFHLANIYNIQPLEIHTFSVDKIVVTLFYDYSIEL